VKTAERLRSSRRRLTAGDVGKIVRGENARTLAKGLGGGGAAPVGPASQGAVQPRAGKRAEGAKARAWSRVGPAAPEHAARGRRQPRAGAGLAEVLTDGDEPAARPQPKRCRVGTGEVS